MILFSTAKKPAETWVGVTAPDIQFVNVETGETSSDLDTLERPGALIVFTNLPDALEQIALKLSEKGVLEIYGDSLSAAWWRLGRSGVRFTGLQGYGARNWSLTRALEFWGVLTEICKGADTVPGATPGTTALRIVANTSPRRISSHGKRIQEFAQGAFSAGARHSKSGHYKDAHLYDIHSAFPFAMRHSLPFGDGYFSRRDAEFSIMRLTFDYDSDLEFSPLWVRAGDRVYHPTRARHLTLTLNSIDLETLRRHGTLKILRLHDQLNFECEPLLEPAQLYLQQWQKQVPQFRSQIKILRNSIYGKLAQQSTQKRFVLKRIKNIKDAIENKNLWRDYNGFEIGLYRHESSGHPFTHFPVAGAITAHVRSMVYSALDNASIAVRTDAILSKRPRLDLDFGHADGQWDRKESDAAVVFGDSGFLVGNSPHLDGVQQFQEGEASTERRAKFAFGEDKELVTWRPAIEPRQTVTAAGDVVTVRRGRSRTALPIKKGHGL